MNRQTLLKRAVGAVAGLALGRHLELLSPAPTLAWPEGTFLLDQGTLELGVVRDSVLTSQNDFQLFAETFRVCKVRVTRLDERGNATDDLTEYVTDAAIGFQTA